ncbi:MAG: signal peptidase I [Chloroflexia bacterium]
MSFSVSPPEEGGKSTVSDPGPAVAGEVPARSSLWALFREILETLLFTLLIFFLVRSVIQNFKVEGYSMEPNLHTGQYIIVNRLEYWHIDLNLFRRLLPGGDQVEPNLVYFFHMPRRGEIVVFEYPKDTTRDFIKRVIGLPGETVEIRNGQVLINGVPLFEPYLSDAARAQTGNMGPVQVPPNAVFVMGDNRGNSSDSRNWGPLPLENIVGKAWVIYWPQQYWGIIPHAEPVLGAP